MPRLIAEMLFSGGIAVAYVLTVRRPRWLPVLVLAHILLWMELTQLARTAPLAGASLAARIQADTNGVVVSLIASFVLLSNFVQREGSRVSKPVLCASRVTRPRGRGERNGRHRSLQGPRAVDVREAGAARRGPSEHAAAPRSRKSAAAIHPCRLRPV